MAGQQAYGMQQQQQQQQRPGQNPSGFVMGAGMQGGMGWGAQAQ